VQRAYKNKNKSRVKKDVKRTFRDAFVPFFQRTRVVAACTAYGIQARIQNIKDLIMMFVVWGGEEERVMTGSAPDGIAYKTVKCV